MDILAALRLRHEETGELLYKLAADEIKSLNRFAIFYEVVAGASLVSLLFMWHPWR